MKWGAFVKMWKMGVFFVKKVENVGVFFAKNGKWGYFCKKVENGFFGKKVENGRCFLKKWKMGVFLVKKWTFPLRRVHCVQHQ